MTEAVFDLQWACGGGGPNEITSSPALESQEPNCMFFFPIHFLFCSSSSSVFPAISLGFIIFGEIFAYAII